MPSPEKRKGNRYESELVNEAINQGIDAKRAWGSNGEALGETPEVDCLIGGFRVQAKIRKHIADYLHVPNGCDAVCFRQTSGPIKNRRSMVLMDYQTFLGLIAPDGNCQLQSDSSGPDDVFINEMERTGYDVSGERDEKDCDRVGRRGSPADGE